MGQTKRRAVRTTLLLLSLFAPFAVLAECGKVVARAESVEGLVETRANGAALWTRIKPGEEICAGMVIRVLAAGSASITLDDETVIRVDKNTTITVSGGGPTSAWARLEQGAAHFISKVRRTFQVITPFVNAGVEGTEFVVLVNPAEFSQVTVFEGRVRAENQLGTVLLSEGQSAIARQGEPPILTAVVKPADAVHWALYYPTVLYQGLFDETLASDLSSEEQSLVRRSLEAFRAGDQAEATELLRGRAFSRPSPKLLLYRSTLLLGAGDPIGSERDLNQALKAHPRFVPALALKAVIALVQNRAAESEELAARAYSLDKTDPAAALSLSYVRQSQSELERAKEVLEAALQHQPENALLLSRLSELLLSAGEREEAVATARRAVEAAPDAALAHSILGFAYLVQKESSSAKQAFQKARTLSPKAPLAYLGLGLASIRNGELSEGRRQLEVAASLDPGSSLIRSYLGKAYFEENRTKAATAEFQQAKKLDPNDPTPWLYDSVLKLSVNRPVEALKELERSIELNRNRAPYRSRFYLDQDLAARNTSLARTYNVLGFNNRALFEGWRSASTAPTDASGHRFLSDAYLTMPRHEVARLSELLQAQLLQPANARPLQPQLTERNLELLRGSGPTEAALNEYNELFMMNGHSAEVNGYAGSQDTLADDVVVSGVFDKFSYSVGQFHLETDGYRRNNDQERDIYNVFAQHDVSDATSVQFEARYGETMNGDIPFRFERSRFDEFLQSDIESKSVRLGGRHSLSSASTFLASATYREVSEDQDTFIIFPENPSLNMPLLSESDQDAWMGELQHLYKGTAFSTITGVSFIRSDLQNTDSFSADTGTKRSPYNGGYFYSYYTPREAVSLVAGVSLDDFEEPYKDLTLERRQVNPKFGFMWNPAEGTTVRAAAFRTMRRSFINDQTIEPTQISGFNQFYDDATNGTDAKVYGIGLDQKLSSTLFAGIALHDRELDVPYYGFDATTGTATSEMDGWKEREARGYFYWAPTDELSLALEHTDDRFERSKYSHLEEFYDLDSQRTSLRLTAHLPSGVFGFLEGVYVDQKGWFWTGDTNDLQSREQGQDSFPVANAGIGYRLPKRRGIAALELRNIFDEQFNYQASSIRALDVAPDRTLFARFRLFF